MSHAITFAVEAALSADEFVSVLRRSTLAERRPVDDPGRIALMLKHANLIVTARDAGGVLVGVSRAVTDFSFCCYLSDLAVDVAVQKRGIGRELIRRTHEASKPAKLILLAAPAASAYYPHIGMTPHDSCWTLDAAVAFPAPPGGGELNAR